MASIGFEGKVAIITGAGGDSVASTLWNSRVAALALS